MFLEVLLTMVSSVGLSLLAEEVAAAAKAIFLKLALASSFLVLDRC